MTPPRRTNNAVVITTPENVPLTFQLAGLWDRAVALVIDLTLVAVTVLLLSMLFSLLLDDEGGVFVVSDADLLMMAFITLVTFLVWNFYFIAAELRWRGQTVGKRVAKIRVIARDGGPLEGSHIFARNLTRDLEMLLPIAVIGNPAVLGLESGWELVIGWLWLGAMATLPLFNKLRARVGDFVAGTLVVSAPTMTLLPDLVADAPLAPVGQPVGVMFTQAQLDLYGIHELQILEDVLRRYPVSIDEDLLDTIANKIRLKIDWSPPEGNEMPPTIRFLESFYAAQRARLEHKMLFGERQEFKVDA